MHGQLLLYLNASYPFTCLNAHPDWQLRTPMKKYQTLTAHSQFNIEVAGGFDTVSLILLVKTHNDWAVQMQALDTLDFDRNTSPAKIQEDTDWWSHLIVFWLCLLSELNEFLQNIISVWPSRHYHAQSLVCTWRICSKWSRSLSGIGQAHTANLYTLSTRELLADFTCAGDPTLITIF